MGHYGKTKRTERPYFTYYWAIKALRDNVEGVSHSRRFEEVAMGVERTTSTTNETFKPIGGINVTRNVVIGEETTDT